MRTVKANADAASSAASPTATTAVCTSSPVQRPSTTVSPARVPCMADWSSTKILSGPGARLSRTAIPRKVSRVSIEGIGALRTLRASW
ncbi:hypothetical protein D3C86_1710380 [compost metagenome]